MCGRKWTFPCLHDHKTQPLCGCSCSRFVRRAVAVLLMVIMLLLSVAFIFYASLQKNEAAKRYMEMPSLAVAVSECGLACTDSPTSPFVHASCRRKLGGRTMRFQRYTRRKRGGGGGGGAAAHKKYFLQEPLLVRNRTADGLCAPSMFDVTYQGAPTPNSSDICSQACVGADDNTVCSSLDGGTTYVTARTSLPVSWYLTLPSCPLNKRGWRSYLRKVIVGCYCKAALQAAMVLLVVWHIMYTV